MSVLIEILTEGGKAKVLSRAHLKPAHFYISELSELLLNFEQ